MSELAIPDPPKEAPKPGAAGEAGPKLPSVPDLGPLASFGFATPSALDLPPGSNPNEGRLKAVGGVPVPRANPAGVKGSMDNNRVSKVQRKIIARQREGTALALRRAAFSLDYIATHLGVSTSAVSRMVKRATARIVNRTEWSAMVNMVLELDRLDTLNVQLLAEFNKPTTPVETKIKLSGEMRGLSDQRSRLLSLYGAELPKPPTRMAKAEAVMTPLLKGATVEQLERMKLVAGEVAALAAGQTLDPAALAGPPPGLPLPPAAKTAPALSPPPPPTPARLFAPESAADRADDAGEGDGLDLDAIKAAASAAILAAFDEG